MLFSVIFWTQVENTKDRQCYSDLDQQNQFERMRSAKIERINLNSVHTIRFFLLLLIVSQCIPEIEGWSKACDECTKQARNVCGASVFCGALMSLPVAGLTCLTLGGGSCAVVAATCLPSCVF